jgi:prepilin-type N-terminal cleavage/methylation domain-containing protein
MNTRARTERAGRRRGFTLVEAVAAMSIIAALGSVGSAFIYSGISSARNAYASLQLHEEASSALERIVRELRRIPLDGSAGTIAPTISAVTATSISYGTNSSLTLNGGSIVYVDSGTPAATLLSGVTSFDIQCSDESNTPMNASLSGSACYPIRRIQVTITCARDGISETVRTRVFIRGAMKGGVS